MPEPAENLFVPEFPGAIPLGDLLATHADYDAKTMAEYRALYKGGREFHKHLNKFLIKRQIECGAAAAGGEPMNPLSAGDPYQAGADNANFQNGVSAPTPPAGGGSMYESRKKIAWYHCVVAGIIDFLIAMTVQSKPGVTACAPDTAAAKPVDPTAAKPSLLGSILARMVAFFGGDESADGEDSPAEFYHELNGNCDGTGASLSARMRDFMLSLMLHNRAWTCVTTPPSSGAAELGAAVDAGDYDCQLRFLAAEGVDDWYLIGCVLQWARTHATEATRSIAWQQPDREKHTWTYITPQALYVYAIDWPIGKPPPDTTLVPCVAVTPHDMGVLPIRLTTLADGLWVMERLYDTVLALFNRQTSATWALNCMAYALLTILSKRRGIGDIVADELSALLLDPEDDAKFINADPAVFDALQKDLDALELRLYQTVNSMVLVASARDQQGRASGVAKKMDFSALTTLAGAFAEPPREALKWGVDLIHDFRGEVDAGLAVAVRGMDAFDCTTYETLLDNTTKLLTLPNVSKTAVRWSLLKCALQATNDAPPAIQEAVMRETLDDTAAVTSDQKKAQELALTISRLSKEQDEYLAAGDLDRANAMQSKIDGLAKYL